MPRKTDSNNPADWLFIAESDLTGIKELAQRELSYELCRGKLAEVVEKILKAALIYHGWFLEKTHDLEKLAGELRQREPRLADLARPLVIAYAELYFLARYPGFDLEDPDWERLREDVAATEHLLGEVKRHVDDPESG